MEEKKLNSLNIEGMGTYTGGTFDRVNVSGKGRITGEITCKSLDVSGMSTMEQSVKCEDARMSGLVKFEGSLEAEEVEVSGKATCLKTVKTNQLYLSGMLRIKQCLNASKAIITGMLTVEGDLSGEYIESVGMLNCDGFLNCEKLEINSKGTSKLNEVGAAIVKISNSGIKHKYPFSFLIPEIFRENKVVAASIEGDEITIENCEVKVVRGKNIHIGEGCKVGLVEYSETLTVDENAQVEESNKL